MTPGAVIRAALSRLPDDVKADALAALAEIEAETLVPATPRRRTLLARLYDAMPGPSARARREAVRAAVEAYRESKWKSEQHRSFAPTDPHESLCWQVLKEYRGATPSVGTILNAVEAAGCSTDLTPRHHRVLISFVPDKRGAIP